MVLGISGDSPKKHRKFKDKYHLPYTLLSDPDHAVAERYGVWSKKHFWGRFFWGVARTTFVIGPDGRIMKVFEKVKPAGHGEELANFLAAARR